MAAPEFEWERLRTTLVRRWPLIVGLTFSCLAAGLVYRFVAMPLYQAQARVLIVREGMAFDHEAGTQTSKYFLATQAEVLASPLTIRAALDQVPVTPPHEATDSIAYVMERLQITPKLETDVVQIRYRSFDQQQPVQLINAIISSYQDYLRETEQSQHSTTLSLLADQEAKLRNELKAQQQKYEEFRRTSPLMGEGRDAVDLRIVALRELSDELASVQHRAVSLEQALHGLEQQTRKLTSSAAGPVRPAVFSPSGRVPEWHAASIETGFAENYGRSLAPADVQETILLMSADVASRVQSETARIFSDVSQAHQRELQIKLASLARIEEQLADACANAQALAESFGSQHIKRRVANQQVISLETQLREQEKEISELRGHHAQEWSNRVQERIDALRIGLTHSLETSRATEEQLAERYQQYREEIKLLDDYLVQERLLTEEIDRLKLVHNTLLAKLADFQLADQALAEGRGSTTVRVLEEPDVTLQKVWPKTLPLMVLCLIVGLSGGALFVLVDYRRQVLRAWNIPSPSKSTLTRWRASNVTCAATINI